MKFIGKFGEHVALSRLLANGIEAYPAIKANQDSYDITAISARGEVLRVQVKTTKLDNATTNNTIGRLPQEFHFLIIVIVQSDHSADCYVLTRKEAIAMQGDARQLGVSRQVKKVSVVKDALIPHKEDWAKLRDAQSLHQTVA
jgi:hypothetical protein